ncbi:hypothetical protein Agub_g5517 [Astrephomene gubernaculifera]|uniref:EGF-like domain-containing protein n=1 Tax=Astrephomene gubernaculifera TaxID=47775 RepID=A0AAD3DM00_9CHLO|nr:hypothetical protein Agub_g5517 [Astrephomene gubernaculifera]
MHYKRRLARLIALLLFARLAASSGNRLQAVAAANKQRFLSAPAADQGRLTRAVRRHVLAHRSSDGQRALLYWDTQGNLTVHGAGRQLTLNTSTHPDVRLDHLFVPLNRSCHPDCTKRGNCNAEEGRCECPFGYTGPTCSDPLMPACQLGPLLEPFFGFTVPRSCECVRQARTFFGCSDGGDTCTLSSFGFRDVFCYQYPDRPPGEQWSLMPELTTPGVEYFRGNVRQAVALRPLAAVEGVAGEDLWGNHILSLPLERCGESKCHGRGACIVPLKSTSGTAVQEASSQSPHCMCYKGYKGHTCGESMDYLCPGECRGRGRCSRGFCHCDPPYWGLDCSREHAWQLAPGVAPVPNRVRLRIYVYDLPANVAAHVSLDDNIHDLNEGFYQTHRKFLEMLLMDPDVRTENPHEANLFLVPANAYSYSSNTNPPANQIASALTYVAHNYPWFNASGGRDHVVWTTGDRGSCYTHKNLSHVIFVTLFGLHADLREGGSTFLHPLPTHPGHGCYHPMKDVLAAPLYDYFMDNKDAVKLYNGVRLAGGEDAKRDLLFFFAGSVRPNDKVYSGGVRQSLSVHLKELVTGPHAANYSDVLFIEGFTPDYESLHRRSKFCLAPHGAGFGVRLTTAMTHACVPVIIQDQVYQPYESEGVLPYHEFSLRLGRADIPNIVHILRSVTPERMKAMRLAMANYYRAFLWDPRSGGLAYNYTVLALERRLHGVWGRLWPGGEQGQGQGGHAGQQQVGRRRGLMHLWQHGQQQQD